MDTYVCIFVYARTYRDKEESPDYQLAHGLPEMEICRYIYMYLYIR